MRPPIFKAFRKLRNPDTTRIALAIVAAGLISVGLASSWVGTAQAVAGTNKQLNFQGRLLTSAGAVVADGTYNMRFKVYCDGDGVLGGTDPGSCTAHASNEHLFWTEEYRNSLTQGVVVKNGYFSVALGTYCALDGSACSGGQSQTNTAVDFNQTTLWLSMDVGGTTGGAITYDGEMTPYKRLTSAVYALNAGQLGGMTASQFVQLAAGVQTASVTSNPAIGINATSGSNNLITLQASGTDVFDVSSTGNLQFGNNADKTISVATAASGNNGNKLTVQGGSGNGTNKNGGDLVLQGGNSTGSGTPGSVIVKPQTDLATAFQVQNSSGASLFTVDTATNNVSVLGNNGPMLGAWATTTAMTVNSNSSNTRVRGGAVAANGYLYHIGGMDGSPAATGSVEYAKLNADGTVGTWAGTTGIPTSDGTGRKQFQPVVGSNGYLYVIGGRDDSNGIHDSVWYAKLTADGAVGTWTKATNSIPEARFGQGTVTYNGYLYVIGGFASGPTARNSVYSAKMNGDGSVGSWTTLGQNLTTTLSNINGSIVANGYVYVPGGWDGSSFSDEVYYAKLNIDGTTGSWSTVAPGHVLSSGGSDENLQSFVGNGYLYVVGADYNNRVVSFPLNGDGTLGSVATLTSLPVGTMGEAAAASANGYLYLLGGSSSSDGGGTARNSVYYTSTSRLKVGGGLDLVGYTGENLGEGRSGGILTAGNTTVVGTLQVQDTAWFTRGVSIVDTLTVGGAAVFQNAANSTTALQVETAAGAPVFDVDTSNARVGINKTNPGYALDVTGDISTTTQYRIGATVVCTATGCTPTAGSGNYINNGTSLQTASFYVQGGSGVVSGVLEANGADALDIKNASHVNVLTVGATGDLLVKPSTSSATAFQVQPSGSSTPTLVVNSSNGRVGINMTTPGYALDVNGDINASASVSVGGIPVCTVSSCTPASGSNNYIQNGTTAQVDSNYYVRSAATNAITAVIEGKSGQTANILQVQSWNGTSSTTLLSVSAAGALGLIGGQTQDLTTASASSAAALTIQPGTSSGASSNGPATTVKGGDASGTTSVTGGALTLQGGSATGGSGTRNGGNVAIDAGTGATANGSILIGGTNDAAVVLGKTTGTSSITVGQSTASNTITIGNANTANTNTQTISIGAGTPAGTGKAAITIGNTSNASSLTLQAGTGNLNMLTNSASASVIVKTNTNSATAFQVQNSGSTAILNVDTSASKVTVSGDLVIDKRTDSGGTAGTDMTVASGAAGAPCASAATSVDTIKSSVVYNGSLYVGTSEQDKAEVCRYDGGTTFTRMNSAAGTFGSNANTDTVGAMTVFNGYLYIGTTGGAAGAGADANTATLYRWDGSTTFTKLNTTQGTFDTQASVDSVVSMAVYQGYLIFGTSEIAAGVGKGQIIRYDGGSTFVKMNNTAGRFDSSGAVTAVDTVTSLVVWRGDLYAGLGATSVTGKGCVVRFLGDPNNNTTDWAIQNNATGDFTVVSAIDEVTQLIVYNGAMYASVGKTAGGSARLLKYYSPNDNTNESWAIVTGGTAGTIGSTASIDYIKSMTVYNGSLYLGTQKANAAEVYRWDGPTLNAGATSFTRVSSGTAGTIKTSGTASIDAVATMVGFNDLLFMGTSEANSAEVYTFTQVEGQSRALYFNAASDNAGSTEQASYPGQGSIFFAAEQSGNPGIQGGGGMFVFSHGITTATSAYDVAEDYPTRDDTLKPGDLVSIDPHERGFVRKAAGPYDSGLVGVYSEKPALRLSQTDTTINGGRAVPVALAGRVPVQVSTENGAILPGDPLTSSSRPGVAMKATSTGRIVGMSMEAYSGTADGKVTTFVNPNYYSGTPELQSSSAMADAVVHGTLTTKDLVVTNKATIKTLNVTGEATAGSLAVTGLVTAKSLVATDSISTKDLVVSGSADLADVSVSGHLATKGTKPVVTVEPGAGKDATVTVEGNDVSGTITLTAGAESAAGNLLKTVFAKPYGKAPNVVISPNGSKAAGLQAFLGDYAADSFYVGVNVAPEAGQVYKFEYFVTEAGNY